MYQLADILRACPLLINLVEVKYILLAIPVGKSINKYLQHL